MSRKSNIMNIVLTSAAVLSAVCLLAAVMPVEKRDVILLTPDGGDTVRDAPAVNRADGRSAGRGWPVFLDPPGAGFPYTPTLHDVDNDGADEIFLFADDTFGLKGDGSFLPGWPVQGMQYQGWATNGNKPGPSAADVDGDGDSEILWTERDWWAGSSIMWCFNGKHHDGTDLPGFPQQAPNQTSNALDTPFVLGDTDGDGDLEAWGAHTLGNNFTHYRISGFDHLGTLLFTVDLNASENVISLYFGDLDGDGTDEMFAVTKLGSTFNLYAFHSNGGIMPGYPVALYTLPGSAYDMFGPPVPADLDKDGDLEILIGYNYSSASHARCFHHDGTAYPGFPIQIATSSQLFYLGLGDVTADGNPELLASENHLTGNYRMFAYDLASGTLLPGWPYLVSNWPKGFPAVVDVDDDGVQDVCFTTDGGELYAVSGAGQLVGGYPKLMSGPSISGVAAGDIDGDGYFELVAATWDGWAYAWDTPSQVLPGRADWPMRGVNARNTGVYGDSPYARTLSTNTHMVSETSGAKVSYSLFAGPPDANRDYILLGSASGTSPGIPLPGGTATLPLNWDPVMSMVIALINTPVFSNFMGTLDGLGKAGALFDTLGPLPPGSAGVVLHFAYALNKPWNFASNPVAVKIVP